MLQNGINEQTLVGCSIFFFIVMAVSLSGCIGGYGYPNSDIGLIKVDGDLKYQWHLRIDSGMDDYAESVIQTKDSGFAVAGYIARKGGVDTHPRIIGISPQGVLQWDQHVDSLVDSLVALNQSPDNDFLGRTYNGKLLHFDSGGHFISILQENESSNIPRADENSHVTLPSTIRTSAITTMNNSYIAAGFFYDGNLEFYSGSHGNKIVVAEFDKNGMVIRSSQLDSPGNWNSVKSIISTNEGGYAVLTINNNL